jgi:hypothetical protein
MQRSGTGRGFPLQEGRVFHPDEGRAVRPFELRLIAGLTGCGKTQGAVILSEAKNLSLFFFLDLNRRENRAFFPQPVKPLNL